MGLFQSDPRYGDVEMMRWLTKTKVGLTELESKA